MARVPKEGDVFNTEDLEMLIEALGRRSANFPDEPTEITMALVFFNIGDRFTKVECVEQEWKALKKDIPRGGEGVPKCPNGHSLLQGPPLKIGWVREKDE